MMSDKLQQDTPPSTVVRWKRRLYLAVSGVFFVLGFLGAVLPGLPATPFLLLTSYFLVRSSPALNEKLLHSRFVGPILQDWQQCGGVRGTVKVQAIVVVIIVAGATLYFTEFATILRWTFIAAVVTGIVVICWLPNATKRH